MTEIIDARVDWCDGYDNAPEVVVLVDEYPDWSEVVYRRFPINAAQSISDEQQAVVGGSIPESPTPGWYAYIGQAGPLLSMKTSDGQPGRGQAGGRIKLDLEDGGEPQEFVVVNGWHPGAATARAAGLEAVSTAVFRDRGSWERGHTAMAGFVLVDAAAAALADSMPEVVWEHPEPPRWWGQPSKAEWHWLEKTRCTADRLWWAAEHGGFDYWSMEWRPGNHGPGDSPGGGVRPYSQLGPAALDAYGRVADARLRKDWITADDRYGVPRDQITPDRVPDPLAGHDPF